MAIALSQLPRDYEVLVRTGRTACPGDAYLAANDAEWIPQDKLGDPDWFYPHWHPIPHLLPFACTGGHDLWCWRLDVPTGDREFEIISGPKDSYDGDRWAPTFATWAFRKAIEIATGLWAPEPESRAHLTAWGTALGELGHSELSSVVTEISARPLREQSMGKGSTFTSWQYLIDQSEYRELVCSHVGDAYWKSTLFWMIEDGEAAAD